MEDCKEIKELTKHDLINVNEDTILEISNIFKMIQDPTRLKILLLLINDRYCVCDIADSLEMTHSATSHQCRLLRMSNLVKTDKEGKHVYYSLADKHIETIIKMTLVHVKEC